MTETSPATQSISIDVGSGYTKAIFGNKHIHFQSVVSASQGEDVFLADTLDKVTNKGRSWLVGQSAVNSSDKLNRENTLSSGWAGSEGWMALLLAAIAQLGVEGKINVITGIPQSQYPDKERRNAILLAMTGKHQFEWKSRKIDIEIQTAFIMPQATGALFCKAQQDSSILKRTVGLVDIGTFTTGLSVMKDRSLVHARSGGTTPEVGVSDLITALSVRLLKEYGYTMDKADGPNLLMSKEILNRGVQISIEKDIDILSKVIAKPMVDAINELWDGGNDLLVFITGGGAPYFISALYEVVPHAKLMENNFYAVASGMLLWFENYVKKIEAGK